jgi:hypothetical protein
MNRAALHPLKRFALAFSLGILGCTGGFHSLAQDSNGVVLSASLVWTGQPDAGQTNGAFVGFRKSFQLTNATNPVTLRIFADARYLLWINGQYVQRGPGRFEPSAPEYDSLDLTPFVQSGTNVVAVLVTSRISNGRVRMHAPGLAAHIVQSGQTITATDATWKWSDQTRYRKATTDWPNIYDEVDARVETGDWTLAAYDDSAWAAAQAASNSWGALTASRIPLRRETVVMPAWNGNVVFPVTLTNNQQVTFQFPRIVLAYVEIQLDADAGSVLQLTYSTPTKITCRAGAQTYISTDTHSIYSGGLMVTSGRVTLKSVKFVERLYPFDRIGGFSSSDALLNKLWTTCVRGLEVISEDAYVDCTDRERVEWMDCDPPTFDVTRVAMAGVGTNGQALYADPRLSEEMLRRTAYTLQPDGWVKAHTCSDRFDIHAKMEDRACDWVQGARRYYESCGRTNVLQEIWPAIVTQMNYFLDRRSVRGLVLAREWVVWGNPVGYQTCEGTALNAFIQRALVDAAYVGNAIGQTAQAGIFQQAATNLAAAMNTVLWNENAGSYYAGYYDLAVAQSASDYRLLPLTVANNLIEPTRHAALFALDQGIVPENRRARVTQYLMAHPPTENDIMQYYYFFKQQYALDNPAQDRAVLDKLRTEWADMAYSPYEATFEALHSGGSQAHCYGMFPAYFLSAYTLGVRLEGPVWKNRILIEPRLGDLASAQGVVVTEHGPVPVAWSQPTNAQLLTFSFTIPEGIRATVHLPKTSDTNTLILNGATLVNNGVLSGGVTVTGRWFTLDLPPGTNAGTLTLTMLAPTIETEPAGGIAFPGDTFSFSVNAYGQNLAYQWRKNSTNLLNATNSILTLTNLALAATGDYQVTVSNPISFTNSAVASLQVVPTITNTLYLDHFSGTSGALNVRTPDTATIGTNKWIAASAWRTDGIRANITNATANAFLPFVPVAGQVYRLSADINCVGTGNSDWLSLGFAYGTNTGTAWQSANNPVGWMLARDSGTSTLDGQTFLGPGTTGSVNTGVYPTGTMNYAIVLDTRPAAWTFTFLVNSNIVVPATAFGSSGPTISSIGIGMLSGGGSAQVDNLTLLKLSSAAPTINSQPQDTTVPAGGVMNLSVGVTGAAPLSYQWRKNSGDILNATNSTLTITNISPSDAGSYNVTITNVLGSASSSNAIVTVVPGIVVVTTTFDSGNVTPSIPVSTNNDLVIFNVASVNPAANGNNFTGVYMRNGTTGTAYSGNGGTGSDPASIMANGVYDFILDTNVAPNGFDIASIVTYSGWTDSRAGQDHSLWYQAVGSSGFTKIADVTAAASAGSLRVAVNQSQGPLATGVQAIRVVLNQNYFVYRELVVAGSATVVSGPPVLYIALQDTGSVNVWWPTSATGYTLESTPGLGASAAWQTVTNPPVTTNGNYQVVLPVLDKQFLRLQK